MSWIMGTTVNALQCEGYGNLASVKLFNVCYRWRCQSFQAPLVSPSPPPGAVSAPSNSSGWHRSHVTVLERMEYHPAGSKENLEGLNREMYLQEGWDSGQAISLGGPC